MQLLLLLILGALASVMLYHLYSVLGRRVGRQPEEGMRRLIPRPQSETDGPPRTSDAPPPSGVAAIRARDPSFDPARFLDGARTAYESIVRAFATGDRETLKRLVSVEVFERFVAVIDQRDSEGRSSTVEFLHPARADLDFAEVQDDVARARVRFLAELRSRSKGPEGEAVDDRRTAELWTFERRFDNRDPNWTLTRVDAAEA